MLLSMRLAEARREQFVGRTARVSSIGRSKNLPRYSTAIALKMGESVNCCNGCEGILLIFLTFRERLGSPLAHCKTPLAGWTTFRGSIRMYPVSSCSRVSALQASPLSVSFPWRDPNATCRYSHGTLPLF